MTSSFSFISAVCFAGRIGAAPTPRIALAEPERAYIESHPVITASNEQKWAPLNFFDNGRPKGFSIDYLSLLADKAGLNVEYVSGPCWKEFVELAKKRSSMSFLTLPEMKSARHFSKFCSAPGSVSITAWWSTPADQSQGDAMFMQRCGGKINCW